MKFSSIGSFVSLAHGHGRRPIDGGGTTTAPPCSPSHSLVNVNNNMKILIKIHHIYKIMNKQQKHNLNNKKLGFNLLPLTYSPKPNDGAWVVDDGVMKFVLCWREREFMCWFWRRFMEEVRLGCRERGDEMIYVGREEDGSEEKKSYVAGFGERLFFSKFVWERSIMYVVFMKLKKRRKWVWGNLCGKERRGKKIKKWKKERKKGAHGREKDKEKKIFKIRSNVSFPLVQNLINFKIGKWQVTYGD